MPLLLLFIFLKETLFYIGFPLLFLMPVLSFGQSKAIKRRTYGGKMTAKKRKPYHTLTEKEYTLLWNALGDIRWCDFGFSALGFNLRKVAIEHYQNAVRLLAKRAMEVLHPELGKLPLPEQLKVMETIKTRAEKKYGRKKTV
jgi:hypothetical protein